MTATLTDADGDITSPKWQWERSPGTGELEWSAISGAESSIYMPIAPDDAGELIPVTQLRQTVTVFLVRAALGEAKLEGSSPARWPKAYCRQYHIRVGCCLWRLT